MLITFWQNEKLLVLSNFFICYTVFRKPSAQRRQKASICGDRVFLCLYEYCGYVITNKDTNFTILLYDLCFRPIVCLTSTLMLYVHCIHSSQLSSISQRVSSTNPFIYKNQRVMLNPHSQEGKPFIPLDRTCDLSHERRTLYHMRDGS